MKNNLRKISQELRAFAKRTKDFKYTNSALITFLMTGMLFASNNIFAENENTDIKNQVNQINTSINQIRTDFKRARKENNKLIKDTVNGTRRLCNKVTLEQLAIWYELFL